MTDLHSRKQVYLVQELCKAQNSSRFFSILVPEKSDYFCMCITHTACMYTNAYFLHRNNLCTWLLAKRTAFVTLSVSACLSLSV